MLKFELTNMTALYDKGLYALKALDGYQLRNRKTGEVKAEVTTRDYTEWETIEYDDKAAQVEKEKNEKAVKTLSAILRIAIDSAKLDEMDERLTAFDSKLRERYPEAAESNEQLFPPIAGTIDTLREAGLGEFADIFDKVWHENVDINTLLDAMPDVLPADNGEDGDGEGDPDEEEANAPDAEQQPEQEQEQQPEQEQEQEQQPEPTKPAKKGKAKK